MNDTTGNKGSVASSNTVTNGTTPSTDQGDRVKERESANSSNCDDAIDDSSSSNPADVSYIYQDHSSSITKANIPSEGSYRYMLICAQKLPAKLNAILADPETQNIISWMPHGRSWRVHHPVTFAQKVMPKYFHRTNWNSFVRLINAWGFRRMSNGCDRNSYYHELFLKGMPHLHEKMHRLTAREKKAEADPESEPNFYNTNAFKPLQSCAEDGNETPYMLPPTRSSPEMHSSDYHGKEEAGLPSNSIKSPVVLNPHCDQIHDPPLGPYMLPEAHRVSAQRASLQRLALIQEQDPLYMFQGNTSILSSIEMERVSLARIKERLNFQLDIIHAQECRLNRVNMAATSGTGIQNHHRPFPLHGRSANGSSMDTSKLPLTDRSHRTFMY